MSGPVRFTATSHTTLHPATAASITGGLWHERRRINRDVSVPDAWERLHEAGNFHNVELAAGQATGEYVNKLWFLDSDLYKWLEAIGWTLADPELTPERADQLKGYLAATEELLAEAQEEDGYLDSYYQVKFPGMRFEQLEMGHELYCAGHLIQGAVALHRTSGDETLLMIARKVADLIVDSFGQADGKVDGVCGHPEIETALVELYRETGEPAYLDRARYFVDRRGHGLIPAGGFGPAYYQDHTPVREADSVQGHAVRQLYLLAGVADVYAETGDATLLAAAERLFDEMAARKTYLTGGIGAHHQDEAFGDPYELPNERSYAETCAAIASIQFCHRMLLATGEAKYADLLERTLYNGFLGGLSLDGTRYIYANPLQVRDGHLDKGNDGDYTRRPWFYCACCPPNVMRLLGSLEHYAVASSADRVAVSQYWPGSFTTAVGGGEVAFTVETDYPWDGTVRVRVDSAPEGEWTLALRVPGWAQDATLTVAGARAENGLADGWWTISRAWAAGDEVELGLPVVPRLTQGDPRMDAVRGCVAIERGPLVYCLEGLDQQVLLDDVVVAPDAALAEGRNDELGVVTVELDGAARPTPDAGWWPYRPAGEAPTPTQHQRLVAVPYYAWGNRGRSTMRVWLPTR